MRDSSSIRRSSKRAVELKQIGPHVIDILNDEAAAAAEMLTVNHELVCSPERGCELRARRCPLGGVMEAIDHRAVAAGPVHPAFSALSPAITSMLMTAGYVPKLIPMIDYPSPLDVSDIEAVVANGIVDVDLLSFIRQHHHGLIRYGTQVDPARLVGQIALAYPAATLAVAALRPDEAGWLAKHICRWVKSVSISTRRHMAWQPERIAVGTFLSLSSANVKLQDRDIFIAVNAFEIISRNGILPYRSTWKGRFFGLLPDDFPLAAGEVDLVRAHFGFDELHIPAHGMKQLPVNVLFLPVNDGPNLHGIAEPLTLKRRAVWDNPIRNRRLGRLAKLLVAGDRDQLNIDFPGVATSLLSDGPQRVAVEVEGVDHARILARRLPDWLIISGMDGETPSPALNKSIVTTTAAINGQLDARGLDVLIRADGGIDVPGLLTRQWLVGQSSDVRLVLIDFQDRFDPKFRRQAGLRRAAYRAHGWCGPGEDPTSQRVKDFLATRPKG